MAIWRHQVHPLPADHRWTARPGHRIFVADRGAVLFEFPRAWVVAPGPERLEILDRPPPGDRCRLAASYLRLPDADWSGLPLSRLLVDAIAEVDEDIIGRGPVIEMARAGLELAWSELRFVDPEERRQARSRLCLGRGSNIQSVITLDFWPEDEARVAPVWEAVLGSLRLGVQLNDLAGPVEIPQHEN